MSAEVRTAAIDPSRSFLVQAPAGSGKTELLTRRFLRLLAIVDEPEEILALTFTRKAAAEMRGRVIEALMMDKPTDTASHRMEVWQLADAANRRSEEREWHLVAHPSRLNMVTLDSFTHALVRQMPMLSGLGEIPIPSAHVEPLYREAAEAAVEQLVRRDPIQAEAVLIHQDHNLKGLINLVADMLGRRDQWLHGLREHAEDPAALRLMLERNLTEIMNQRLYHCKELMPESIMTSLPALLRFAGDNLNEPLLSGLMAWPDVELEQVPIWQRIADLLLKKNEPALRQRVDKGIGFPADKDSADYKRAFAGILKQLSDIDGLADAFDDLRALPSEPRIEDGQWQVLEAQLFLLLLADGQLHRLFNARGEADFVEIAMRAMQALEDEHGNPTDLLLRLDYRIRHILVDEFQDTSLLQLRLLLNLTEGWQEGDGMHRTLFMVGDPMQSIYRFRKAEVSLFLLAATNGAGLPPVTPLKLVRNFRSSPVIVEWVNRAFAHIFPTESNILQGAVGYSKAHAALAHHGEVHLHLQRRQDPVGEAVSVVDTIRNELMSDGRRIAVLSRSRKHLHAIMQELLKAGIAFRAVDILPLDSRPEIRLLRALLRALLHPVDRVSWAALLRAPCCGLSTSDMYQLLAGNDRPVAEILADEESLAVLDEDARRRASYVYEAIEPCLLMAGRMPVRALITWAWSRLGMLALLDSNARFNIDAMLDLVEIIDEGGLIDFALLDERLEKLYAAPDASPAASRVELLTMHGAKGLQWDVVILPGLGYGSGRKDSPLLAFTDVPVGNNVQPLIAVRGAVRNSDTIYSLVRSIENIRENNELSRLLYVACTRAVTSLHMFGHVTESSGMASEGSLLRLLVPDGIDGNGFGATITKMTDSEDRAGMEGRRRLIRVRELPVLPGPKEVTAVEEVTEFFWAGPEAAPVGNAMHSALQHIGERGIENWNAADSMAEIDNMRRMLLVEGLSEATLEQSMDRLNLAFERVLSSDRGRWILSCNHAEVRSEWALSSCHEGTVAHHVIDRSFVDSNGIRWIVDYKTSEHMGSDTDAFLDEEVRRHRMQLERYARLLNAMDKRPVRLGLYFPMMDGWREFEAADAL